MTPANAINLLQENGCGARIGDLRHATVVIEGWSAPR
jgi:hypothetical protein